MELRALAEADLPALCELWRQAGLPFEPEGRDRLEALRAQRAADPDLWLGAFEGDRLVGGIIGSDDGRKGWLNRLAVLPERRRAGVARALVDACEAALRARGRIIVTALVSAENEASLAFFRAAGYDLRRDILYLRKAWGVARETKG